MSKNTQRISPAGKNLKLVLAGCVYPLFPLCGLLILSGSFLVHILWMGTAFHSIWKFPYFLLILIVGLLILVGLLARTKPGVRLVARMIGSTEDTLFEVRQGVRFRIFESLVLLGVFVSIFLYSLVTKIAVYNLDASASGKDTASYVKTASYTLLDSNFWVSRRPFTVPLFFKMIGYPSQNFTDLGEMERVGRIQLVISILTWTVLALSISFLMKKWMLRFFSFAVVLMVGASLNITMWDHLMLSESLSTSLFVLFLAFLISAANIWRLKKYLAVWLQIVLVIAAIIIATLYSFTRDTNAYFLLSLAGIFLLGLLFRSIRRHRLIADYVVIMASFFTIFVIQYLIMNQTSVFVPPLRHVFVYRFFPDKGKLAYLVENGLPYDQRFSSYNQLTIRQIREMLLIDDPADILNTWIKNHGKQVLFTYMLSHPGYTFVVPLADLQTMLSGDVSYFRRPIGPTPLRLSILTDIFYPQSQLSLILFLLFFGISIFLVFKHTSAGFTALLILTLYGTAFLALLIIWNSDPMIMSRHALQAAIQMRLASWLCLLLLVENLWIYFDKVWSNQKIAAQSAPVTG